MTEIRVTAEQAAENDRIAEQIGQATRDQELADPDAGKPWLDRGINGIAEVIGVAAMATIVSLIFINAVGRYAFAMPIVWAEELVIALIPWLAMSGVFLSVRRGRVIRIDYFVERLPARLHAPMAVFAAVLSAAAFIYLAWHSFSYVRLFGGDPTTYLGLPTGWFTSAMVIGAVAAALAFAAGMLRRQDGPGRP